MLCYAPYHIITIPPCSLLQAPYLVLSTTGVAHPDVKGFFGQHRVNGVRGEGGGGADKSARSCGQREGRDGVCKWVRGWVEGGTGHTYEESGRMYACAYMRK